MPKTIAKNNKIRELSVLEKKLIKLIAHGKTDSECIEMLNISQIVLNRIKIDYYFQQCYKKYINDKLKNLSPYERLTDVKRNTLNKLRKGYTPMQLHQSESINYWIKTDENFKKLYDELQLQK